MKTIIKPLILLIFITSALSCVQKTHVKTIHFKLDMNGVKNVSKVGVRGDSKPLSWKKTFLMTDENNDGIYEGQVQLQSASYDIEFKFVNQDKQFELKDRPNRSIRFEYKPETIVYNAIFNNPEAKQIKK